MLEYDNNYSFPFHSTLVLVVGIEHLVLVVDKLRRMVLVWVLRHMEVTMVVVLVKLLALRMVLV
jgi:hypothetical protein